MRSSRRWSPSPWAGYSGAVAARLPRFAGLTLRGAMGVLAAIPALLLAILAIGLSARLYAPLAAGLAAAPLAFVRAYDRVEAQSGSTHAEYARATGIAVATLLRRDLTYEFRDTLATVAARALAAVTIILSTVSFLGFGATPPARDLGLMIAAAKANLSSCLVGGGVSRLCPDRPDPVRASGGGPGRRRTAMSDTRRILEIAELTVARTGRGGAAA